MPEKKFKCECGGVGWISTSSLSARPCICLQARNLYAHLGAEIAMAPHLRSPLFQPDADPRVDSTEENLFIQCGWNALLPHLRWALGCKYNENQSHRFLITSDERLLTVWLGSESYSQRARSERDDIETYNSLNDFIGDQHLVIIRLGFLGYKNAAAAGVLKQALGIREMNSRPTWVVEDLSCPFGPGHLTWSEDVDTYMRDRFQWVNLRPKNSPVVFEQPRVTGLAAPGTGMAVDEDLSIEESETSVSDSSPPRASEDSLDDDMGVAPSKSRKFKPKWKKPSRGNGNDSLDM